MDKASIQTDMISIIPRLASSREFERPIREFFTASSSTINIFIESSDFDVAYKKYNALKEYISEIHPQIEFSSGYNNDDFMMFFDKYKYHFLANSVRKELLTDNTTALSETAVMNIFSPMSSTSFVDIENDPFILSHHKGIEIISLLSMGNQSLQMKDDLLVSTYDGQESIFLTIHIDSDYQDNFLNDFLPFVESIKTENDLDNNASDDNDVAIYMAGVPLHSYYSKKMAQRDIFIISSLSLLIIFVLFFKTFGSIKPYILSILTILTSSAFAYFMTSVLFDSIHIFTFVFGTSLIGITIDYSIHFLGDYIHEQDSNKTLTNVAKPIILACLTTIISYVFLSFSSVSILKTLAVFSILGMFNTILTVLIIYPIICTHSNMGHLNDKMAIVMNTILKQYERFKPYYKIIFVATPLIALALIYILGVKYDFSANALYNMPEILEQNEIAVAKRLGSDNVSKMIFVGGDSIQDILVIEEDILLLLDGQKLLSITTILPSVQRQKENFTLIKNALLPHLDSQLEILGFDSNIKHNILADFTNAQDNFLDLDVIRSSFLGDIIGGRIIESNGKYYLAMMCRDHIDEAILNSITERYSDNVIVFNLSDEINASLSLAMIEAIKFTAIAYAIIFALMILLFKARSVVIIAIQSLSLILTILAHVVFNIEINMFSVLAIILSLGISIDYIVFFVKQENKKNVVFISIMLSMLTTILSFSTLSFSSFVPVRSFGLSLLFGVLFSFILSPIVNVYSNSTK